MAHVSTNSATQRRALSPAFFASIYATKCTAFFTPLTAAHGTAYDRSFRAAKCSADPTTHCAALHGALHAAYISSEHAA